jgi:hypothetical protein
MNIEKQKQDKGGQRNEWKEKEQRREKRNRID